MTSPFPGMDPYLETRWGDVHTALCTGIRGAIQQKLPAGLRARAEEYVFLETDDDLGNRVRRRFRPDVAFIETSYSLSSAATLAGGSTATLVEPVSVRFMEEDDVERWVQIIDTQSSNRVITVVEVLSPTNKRSGDLNDRYRKKLYDYRMAGVNIVEIDLLRSSRKKLKVQWEDLPENRQATYMTCINRAGDSDAWLCYPMPLRSPLPTIPIPCRETDADVPLALQPLIDQIYVDGGHDDIDYTKPLDNPLSLADAAWAKDLLRHTDVGH